jgi:hypothetical protein
MSGEGDGGMRPDEGGRSLEDDISAAEEEYAEALAAERRAWAEYEKAKRAEDAAWRAWLDAGNLASEKFAGFIRLVDRLTGE